MGVIILTCCFLFIERSDKIIFLFFKTKKRFTALLLRCMTKECMICFCPYTTTEHELCTLMCGHIFGRSCIEPLIRCPVCQQRFTRGEIIKIYATNFSFITYEEVDSLINKHGAQKQMLHSTNFLNKLLINKVRTLPLQGDYHVPKFLEKNVFLKKLHGLKIISASGNNGCCIFSGVDSKGEYVLKYVDLENFENMGKTGDLTAIMRSKDRISIRGNSDYKLYAHLIVGNKFIDLCLVRIKYDFVYEHSTNILVSSNTNDRLTLGAFLDDNGDVYTIPPTRLYGKKQVVFPSGEGEEIKKCKNISKIITPPNLPTYVISDNKIYGVFNGLAILKVMRPSNILNLHIDLRQTILLYRKDLKVVIEMIGESHGVFYTDFNCRDCTDILVYKTYLILADGNYLYKFSYLGNTERYERFDGPIKKICKICDVDIGVFTEKYFYFLK